jgi:hypothetical protein
MAESFPFSCGQGHAEFGKLVLQLVEVAVKVGIDAVGELAVDHLDGVEGVVKA